jgi:Flp pilus assembly pilin Flp
MKVRFAKLWRDDRGALISAEYLFIATILVIGIVVGLTGLRHAINVELTELGNALLALSQGYTIFGTSGNGASSSGSQAIDVPGKLAPPVNTPPANPSDINVQLPT